ncbi:hypothetical protein [Gordonia aurantiaca]|uniref:hypothetical protein n=1 Tax=Gordonia sp. B21 TaxID=3151852 RepID=UPI003264056E
MDQTDGVPTRVQLARAHVDEATRAARLAVIAATPALRARALRRSGRLRIALAGVAALVVVLLVVGAVSAWRVRGYEHESDLRRDVLASARDAIVTMLTADPGDAEAYVDAVLAVSTGAQHERIEAARDVLVAEVAGQPGPSVGQVISAGLVTDPTSGDEGDDADVLVVADATNPVLLGGRSQLDGAADVDATAERITALLTMERAGDGWKIAEARLS